MDKFRVGQKIKVICKDSNFYGDIFTITEIKIGKDYLTREIAMFHVIDVPPEDGIRFGYESHEIAPVYDGDEKSTWTECAWKPKSVETQRQT